MQGVKYTDKIVMFICAALYSKRLWCYMPTYISLLESLTLFISFIVSERMVNAMYLMNRSAFALPSLFSGTLMLTCFGILRDSNTEMLSNSINATVGFIGSDYSINRIPLDSSGDSVNIFFNAFSSLHSGNYTCRSRTSGAERTVFISSKLHYVKFS